MSPDVEQFIRVKDVDCQCAGRTCGPHRCWPTKVGWYVIALLLIAIVVIIGGQATEREEMYGKWREAARADLKQLTDDVTAEVELSQLTFLNEWKFERANERHQFDLAMARAKDVIWYALTPEAEQMIELREALRQWQARQEALSEFVSLHVKVADEPGADMVFRVHE